MIVKASTFADMADLAAYRHAKALGLSEKEALAKGDNGIGCWGDPTAQEQIPMVALPPEDMISTWGSVSHAKHQKVQLTNLGNQNKCIAMVADIMPHLKEALAQNGCRIDCNPATVKMLNMQSGAHLDWEKI